MAASNITSNGVLLCLTLSWKEGSNQVHVSEMKDLEGGWRKRFRVLSGVERKCIDSVGLLVCWGWLGLKGMKIHCCCCV